MIAKAVMNHMFKMLNAIIVARRVTLNVTATNGRKRKGKARRQMKESQPKKS